MRATDAVLGIDVATRDVRASVVAADGTVLGSGSAPLAPVLRGADGSSTQDAGSWWPATVTAMQTALRAASAGFRVRVVAVSVAATSGTVVAVGSGRAVGPASMYDDASAAADNARAAEAGARRWDRLSWRPSATSSLGRVAALLRAHPTARVCHVPELLGEQLTGHQVTCDWSHALKSGYDPLAGEWATEAYAALDVDTATMPAVGAPTSVTGQVSRSAAEQTGLPKGCVVVLGMTDGCAGQLAAGAVAPGAFVSVLGTTLVLKGVTAALLPDPSGVVYSHRHPDGWWLPGGASNTGGEGLAAVSRDLLSELDDAALRRGPATVLAYPLRRDGERFLFLAPAARGFRRGSPVDDADAHRADLEGVAFVERLAYDRLARLGAEVDTVATVGGGTRSAAWVRIRASVLGRPLRVVPGAGSAFGAALLAASGHLHPDLTAAAAAMVPAGRLVEPDTDEIESLTERFRRFVCELTECGWL